MISKREFADVVNQINNRFDWFTNKVEELEKRIVELETPVKKAAPKKAAKKSTTSEDGGDE